VADWNGFVARTDGFWGEWGPEQGERVFTALRHGAQKRIDRNLASEQSRSLPGMNPGGKIRARDVLKAALTIVSGIVSLGSSIDR
jgi:hypothetical protein